VPCIRQKRPAVREHPDKQTEQTQLREHVDLLFHSILLVEKPPAAAELHLAGDLPILKIADHRCQHGIVRRIQVVEYRLRQFCFPIQLIEKPGKCPSRPAIRHRIETGIGTKLPVEPGIIVPKSTDVELHRPTFFGIHFPKPVQDCRLENCRFSLVNHASAAQLLETGGGSSVIFKRHKVKCFKPVIRQSAAIVVEKIMPVLECRNEIAERLDFLSSGFRQSVKIRIVRLNALLRNLSAVGKQGGKLHHLIGAERRQHFDRERVIRRDVLMIGQRIGRIIGGTNEFDVHLLHHAACGKGRLL
jgi:hypothetical protein